MKERDAFKENLHKMNKHYLESQQKYKIQKYWSGYSRIISKQVEVMKGNIFSSNWYFANTFGGGASNGNLDIHNKIRNSTRYKIIDKLNSLLVRYFSNTTLLNFLWRYVTLKRSLWMYTKMASNHYVLMVNAYYCLLEKEIMKYNLNSPNIHGVDLVEIDGKKFSHLTLESFSVFLQILNLKPSKLDIVVEIGAGVGELARIFITTGTTRKYIIVDIPPTLAFSQHFLSTVLPIEKIESFDPNRTSIDLSGDWLCCFLTPDQLTYIPNFDLGLNTFSFGEMTQNLVQSYINELKKKGFQEFISINHRISKSGNESKFGEKEYIEIFGAKYEVKSKYSWDVCRIGSHMLEDTPNMQGYQLLHFIKRKNFDLTQI
jgi:putative sugar O-methyltransferase